MDLRRFFLGAGVVSEHTNHRKRRMNCHGFCRTFFVFASGLLRVFLLSCLDGIEQDTKKTRTTPEPGTKNIKQTF